MTTLINRNRSNKELVVLSNMKQAMFDASSFDLINESEEDCDAVEFMLDKQLAPIVTHFSDQEIDLLYKQLCKGDELIYLPEVEDFTLSSLTH